VNAVSPLRIAIVAGEESGDLLGADLVASLAAATGRTVELMGVGGAHLQALGLKSLFNASELALMGVSAIVRDLPRLLRRIRATAQAIAEARPDCLIAIDSPEFSLRVSRKVRTMRADIPIVHYVCPQVWAWRPGRAVVMREHIDHILCLLPFEPEALQRLHGPPGTFVGHRLLSDPGVQGAVRMQMMRPHPTASDRRTLLLLPGSRRGEIASLIAPFGETLEILRSRGNRLDVKLPTVPHVAAAVEKAVAGWAVKPEILVAPEDKWRAFGVADAALCASGTVSLELALCGVPMISCYRLDWLMRMIQPLVTVWSASLPNLIADRPVVTEHYNQYVRPEYLARQLEGLLVDSPARQWQLEGFSEIRRRMETGRAAGRIAADVVLKLVEKRDQP